MCVLSQDPLVSRSFLMMSRNGLLRTVCSDFWNHNNKCRTSVKHWKRRAHSGNSTSSDNDFSNKRQSKIWQQFYCQKSNFWCGLLGYAERVSAKTLHPRCVCSCWGLILDLSEDRKETEKTSPFLIPNEPLIDILHKLAWCLQLSSLKQCFRSKIEIVMSRNTINARKSP